MFFYFISLVSCVFVNIFVLFDNRKMQEAVDRGGYMAEAQLSQLKEQ